MTIITQGNSSTGTLNYLDSVTVEAGSGFASFESPSGTVVAQFSGVRTFGPFSNRTYRVVAILGDIKYSINDDFPSGSVVQSVPIMGPNGAITGLRNPDGTTTPLGAGASLPVGSAAQVLSLAGDGVTPVWVNPAAASIANDLVPSTSVAPSKTAVNTALALKAAILNPVSLGTGTIALTAATHANHSCGWTGSTDQTITIDTTGGAVGDIYEVSHDGASGILTFPGSAAAGYTMSFGPGVVGVVEWRGGTTFRSQIPNLAPVSVTGSAANGSVLTRTLAPGWTETGGNWTRDGTNIAAATSSTYTTVSADGTHTVTWKSSTIPYIPPGILVAAGAAPTFTAQSAPGGMVGAAYSYTFVATGAVSYAVFSGALPAGLSLNTATGVVSGTPSTAAAYTFVISATNVSGTTNSTSQSVTIASAVGITDTFNRANGALGARSDGGAWTLTQGTAPVISANTLVAGAASGCITADLTKQNGTYSVDVNTTTSSFNPIMRVCADGTATTNYIGVAIDPNTASFAIGVFAHVGGVYTQIFRSVGAVFTSGVTGTLSLVLSGAPSAGAIVMKLNGTTIPMTGVGQAAIDSALAVSGSTRCGIEMPAASVFFDNYSAS